MYYNQLYEFRHQLLDVSVWLCACGCVRVFECVWVCVFVCVRVRGCGRARLGLRVCSFVRACHPPSCRQVKSPPQKPAGASVSCQCGQGLTRLSCFASSRCGACAFGSSCVLVVYMRGHVGVHACLRLDVGAFACAC